MSEQGWGQGRGRLGPSVVASPHQAGTTEGFRAEAGRGQLAVSQDPSGVVENGLQRPGQKQEEQRRSGALSPLFADRRSAPALQPSWLLVARGESPSSVRRSRLPLREAGLLPPASSLPLSLAGHVFPTVQ